MPRFAKETEKPIRKGESVDLKAYLFAERKDKDGNVKPDEKTGEKYENISNALAEALNGATEVYSGEGDAKRLVALETPDVVSEIRLVNLKQKVEGSKDDQRFDMEYVGHRAKTVLGCMILAGGKDDQSFATNDKGEVITDDEGNKSEVPSVTKYFNDGFKVLSNNAARARLTAVLEGPDKAIERAIEQLMKAKGWSREKATAKVKAMMED